MGTEGKGRGEEERGDREGRGAWRGKPLSKGENFKGNGLWRLAVFKHYFMHYV